MSLQRILLILQALDPFDALLKDTTDSSQANETREKSDIAVTVNIDDDDDDHNADDHHGDVHEDDDDHHTGNMEFFFLIFHLMVTFSNKK